MKQIKKIKYLGYEVKQDGEDIYVAMQSKAKRIGDTFNHLYVEVYAHEDTDERVTEALAKHWIEKAKDEGYDSLIVTMPLKKLTSEHFEGFENKAVLPNGQVGYVNEFKKGNYKQFLAIIEKLETKLKEKKTKEITFKYKDEGTSINKMQKISFHYKGYSGKVKLLKKAEGYALKEESVSNEFDFKDEKELDKAFEEMFENIWENNKEEAEESKHYFNLNLTKKIDKKLAKQIYNILTKEIKPSKLEEHMATYKFSSKNIALNGKMYRLFSIGKVNFLTKDNAEGKPSELVWYSKNLLDVKEQMVKIAQEEINKFFYSSSFA